MPISRNRNIPPSSYKVRYLPITRGEREFRACWPLFLGVSWAFRSSSLAFSFLVFGSWAFLVRALLVRVLLVVVLEVLD